MSGKSIFKFKTTYDLIWCAGCLIFGSTFRAGFPLKKVVCSYQWRSFNGFIVRTTNDERHDVNVYTSVCIGRAHCFMFALFIYGLNRWKNINHSTWKGHETRRRVNVLQNIRNRCGYFQLLKVKYWILKGRIKWNGKIELFNHQTKINLYFFTLLC